MRHSALASLAACSLLWLGTAYAATRPHYGGTLRVSMRSTPTSLDPAETAQSGSLAGSNLSSLIFDTLVTLDNRGRTQAALATSWQPEPGNQRWQFKLRHGVTFQDGTPMTAEQVVASLRVSNPAWKIFSAGDEIIIERDSPAPDLPAELTRAHNAIAKRDGSNISGTGLFLVSQWQPGKKLVLSANNDYWAGRPFVDSIEITLSQGFREQAIAFDVGKADLIEVAPEQAHRASGEGRHIQSSAPTELMALAFARDRQSADEARLRESLAFSIDRAALSNVLLQGGGEPAGGLLPSWLTGYGFLLLASSHANPLLNATANSSANRTRDSGHQASAWSLAYDANDPLERLVAERIVLNARDVGMTLQLTTSNNADVRLVRVSLPSLNPRVALQAMADSLHLPPPRITGNSSEDLYAAESMLLNSRQVIPLLYLRTSYGLGASVRNWSMAPDGARHLADVWLSTEK